MNIPTFDEMDDAVEGLLELFEEEGSDPLVEFVKASFGGDRSAAGRYAAQQRWKNHQKKEDSPKDPRREHLLHRIMTVRSLVADAERELERHAANGFTGLPTGNLMYGIHGYADDKTVLERLKDYDSVKGLQMVLLKVPEQADKAGNLKRKSVTWADDARLVTKTLEVPSPELMRLEESVNAVGQEIIDYADTVLKESGVTPSKIDKEIGAIQDAVRANNERDARMREQFNWYSYGEGADRSLLTPEEKAAVENMAKTKETLDIALAKKEEARLAHGYGSPEIREATRVARAAEDDHEEARDVFDNALKNNKVLQECERNEKELLAKRSSIKSITERRYEIINGLLRESRAVGTVEPKLFVPPFQHPSGQPTYQEQVTRQVAEAVKQYIPSGIVAIVNEKYPDISVMHSVNNGYWDRNGKTIATQPNKPYIHLHEYIHAVASASPLAHAMEVALLMRRTTGKEDTVGKKQAFDSTVLAEGRQRVRKTLSYRGGKGKTDHLPDKFVDPYQGRLYDHGSTETLTVAHDFLFSDNRTRDVGPKRTPKEGSIADIDSAGTIIGMLFTLGATE